MATNQEKFNEIHRETVSQEGPSRSFMATDGENIDSPLGILWNTDGNAWTLVLTNGYLFDVTLAVETVEDIAANGVPEGSFASKNPWLAEFGQEYCQGLVKFKAKLAKLFGEDE